MKELSDAELVIKLQKEKDRFCKAEEMFQKNDIGFQNMHYGNLCKVLDNIVVLTKEINRRREVRS